MGKENLPDKIIELLDTGIQLSSQVNGKTNTLRRLRETAFFLSKMYETYKKSNDFDHYMTAYIMLARSVMWIMNKEFKHVKGYKEWYASQKVTDTQERLFRKITKLRNDLTKIAPLKLGATFTFIPNTQNMTAKEVEDFLNEMCGKVVEIRKKEEANRNGIREFSVSGKVQEVDLYHELFSDIMKECRQYFIIISKIVFQCFFKFGVPEKLKSITAHAKTK